MGRILLGKYPEVVLGAKLVARSEVRDNCFLHTEEEVEVEVEAEAEEVSCSVVKCLLRL
jgi:hypothetical protein